MENDRFAKRVHIGESAGSRPVVKPWKRLTDSAKNVKEKEVWMSGKQGEWYRIGVRGNAWGLA